MKFFAILKSNDCCTGKILLKHFVMGKFARMYSAGKILLKCGIYFRSPLLEIFPNCEMKLLFVLFAIDFSSKI